MESSHLLPRANADEERPDIESILTVNLELVLIRSKDIFYKGVQICRLMVKKSFQNAFRQQSIPKSACPKWTPIGCHQVLKTSLWAIALFILISVLNGVLHPSFSIPPKGYAELERHISESIAPGRGNTRHEKIFIATNIINEELIRGSWGIALLELINILGGDNVFVSIYENDSGENTQIALQDLKRKLPCKSSVVSGGHLPLNSLPSIRLPDGEVRVQRLTYLAEVRNRLLRPLHPAFAGNETLQDGFQSAADTHFDKILFLNDVYFSPVEATQLLFSTNMDSNGIARYRTACAVDFVRGMMFYDSFVARDTDGYGMGLMFYPWFAPIGSGTSRQDVRAGKDAVRVRSCWGGMAAFDAAVFRGDSPKQTLHPAQAEISPAAIHDSAMPITFRSSNETFWESAECCLIFADIEQAYGMPNPEAGTGVFINPFIRVAYTETTWRWLPYFRRIEHVFEYLQWIVSHIGYPEYNPRRTHEPGTMVDELVWATVTTSSDKTEMAGNHFFERFQLLHREAQPGGFCGQRRLFVMKTDLEKANMGGTGKNWEKIKIPLRPR